MPTISKFASYHKIKKRAFSVLHAFFFFGWFIIITSKIILSHYEYRITSDHVLDVIGCLRRGGYYENHGRTASRAGRSVVWCVCNNCNGCCCSRVHYPKEREVIHPEEGGHLSSPFCYFLLVGSRCSKFALLFLSHEVEGGEVSKTFCWCPSPPSGRFSPRKRLL